MLKTKFLRNIVLAALALAIALPFYNVFIAYPSFVRSLIEDTRADSERTAAHLKNMLVSQGRGFEGSSLPVDPKTVEAMKRDFNLLKIRVFSPEGEIIYSTDPGDLGDVNDRKYFRDIVAGNRSRTKVVEREGKSLEGQLMAGDVVETYVPITEGDRFLGVFEIYHDITARMEKYEDLKVRSSALLVLMAFGLVALVVITSSRAVKTINERRGAGEKLKKERDRMQQYLDIAGTAIVVLDSSGDVSLLNKRCCEILECSESEILGGNWFDTALPERFRDEVKDVFRQIMSGEVKPHKYHENPVVTKSGQERLIAWSNTVLRDEKGTIVGTLSSGEDVTERKRAEEVLRESEEKFRSLAEQSPNMIFINKRGRIVYVNRKCEEIAGYSREEFCSPDFDFMDLVAPDFHDLVRENFAVHMKGGEVHPYEYAIVTKTGERIEAINTTKLINYEGENAILGIVTDITERKRAEEALLKSETKHRALLEAIPDMMFRISKGYIFLDFKEAKDFPPLLPPTQFLGKNISEILPAEVAEQTMHHVDKALTAGGMEVFEYQLLMDGNLSSYEARIVPCDEEEVLTIIRDITERRKAEEELRIKDSAFASSINAIAIADLEGKLTYVNDSFLKLWGYESAEEVLGKYPMEFAQDSNKAAEIIEELHKGGNYIGETVAMKRDGSSFTVQLSASLVTDKNGDPICMMASFLDITERKRAEEALRHSQEKFCNLFQHSNDGIILHDVEGNIIDVNRKALEQFGYSKAELLSLAVQDLHPPGMREKCENAFEKVSQDGFVNMEVVFRKQSGEDFPAEVSASMFEIAGKKVIQGIVRDITERKLAEEQLERQAYYDQLTALPNRVLFTRQLGHAVMRAKKKKGYLFAVLFMDLDRFKIVNDSLGHMIGDQLLVAVARRLEACIRPDDMVARLGGDEFAILIKGIHDVSDAIRVVDRIQKRLVLPFNLAGQEVFTTASIGIAQSATGYDREEDILRDADSAMYRAKSLGRARYEMFDRSMHVSAMNLLQLEADLRRAVERKEFLLHYQPIVSLEDGRIKSIEALVRWAHPQRGLIQPMEFIPLAEDTGLIVPMGEWILRTACAQAKQWRDAGYRNMRVQVNFSARQFQTQNLRDLVGSVLKETGLEARFMDIEITESIAMEDHSISILNELAAMGVRITIDDFGTGYSSLVSLKRFPIDAIKIDRSLIRDVTGDANTQAIVAAIIAMAHSLRIKVIAEGVETEGQLAFLHSHHCDEMQGYLFSRPVPDAEMTKLLLKGQHMPAQGTTDCKGGGLPSPANPPD
jgi:diguanylate cyclase (GGDEF)-like protein/PAS domain S-box-containing protein